MGQNFVWVGQARVWVGHGLPDLIARTASAYGLSINGVMSVTATGRSFVEAEEARVDVQQTGRQGSREGRATTTNHVHRPKDRQRTARRAVHRQAVPRKTAA